MSAIGAIAAALAGLLLGFVVLRDTFESILLPRRVPGRTRLSRLVTGGLWALWAAVGRRVRPRAAREQFLSLYPLLAIFVLIALWAVGLLVSFALLHRAAGLAIDDPRGPATFASALYYSGTTLFTLGLGDIGPLSPAARVITVIECGMGLAFLALIVSYLPVLYQAFARREARITLLDGWAASPPSAATLLRRAGEAGGPEPLQVLLREWELASAEILESHLSYPLLAFFRSQHDNQSWLASLTTVLDACALLIAGMRGQPAFQARLTFAMARHAVVDLSQAFYLRPEPPEPARLDTARFAELRGWLEQSGMPLMDEPDFEERLADLRAMYEPYVHVLARRLLIELPGFLPAERVRFNWETTAWARTGRDEAH